MKLSIASKYYKKKKLIIINVNFRYLGSISNKEWEIEKCITQTKVSLGILVMSLFTFMYHIYFILIDVAFQPLKTRHVIGQYMK
jgi:hypothetical protein